jgi:hypothetical protein
LQHTSRRKLLKKIDNFDRLIENYGMSDRSIMEQNQAMMEIIIAMAPMGHFAQDYQIFLQWNEASFQESLQSHSHSRERRVVHPADLVLPLIDQVERVLPSSSCNLRKCAEKNMQVWKEGGRQWLKVYRLPSASSEDVLGKTELCLGLEDLLNLNIEMLEKLKKVVRVTKMTTRPSQLENDDSARSGSPLDGLQMVIEMIKTAAQDTKERADEADMVLPEDIQLELRDYVKTIAAGYKNNEFHNFTTLTMPVMLLC